jgi:hypothetical protein
LVNEVSGHAGIDHGLSSSLFHGVRHFEVNWEDNAIGAFL